MLALSPYTIMSEHQASSDCIHGVKALSITPVTDIDTSNVVPQSRNTFSVCFASKAPCPETVPSQYARCDMAEQELAVRAYRSELHEAFVAKHEAAAQLSAPHKEAALKMLVREAAARDISLAKTNGYAAEVVTFMGQTWQTFLRQVANFFAEGQDETDGASPMNQQQRNALAVESISSIGIWFHGPFISLPLRRYSIQVAGPDGEPQFAVVVGLVSFCYSSYVMQTRAATQQGTLCELARLQEQLGTPCHFVPQLLLSPQ